MTEEIGSIILVSFVSHRGGSSSHRPSYCFAVLAAAVQRMQGCSGLGFLSAMILLLALYFVEREQMQSLELLLEKKDGWGSYPPVMASTVCKRPK